ncbi:hypothetical protein Tco_0707121 [Tanacetum coccineum]|uniref:Reverse transcriptase domain-containing protein n=1 Tax=Tanacetum coccineum TaxID=301880 RepID=A0ABQ4Y9E9_9ASTR
MQAARDRQKSYADLKRKPMEFQVGDKVMLKESTLERSITFANREVEDPSLRHLFSAVTSVTERKGLPWEATDHLSHTVGHQSTIFLSIMLLFLLHILYAAFLGSSLSSLCWMLAACSDWSYTSLCYVSSAEFINLGQQSQPLDHLGEQSL